MKEFNQPTNNQKRDKRMKESIDHLFQITKEKFNIKRTTSYESYSLESYERDYKETSNRLDGLSATIDDYKKIEF